MLFNLTEWTLFTSWCSNFKDLNFSLQYSNCLTKPLLNKWFTSLVTVFLKRSFSLTLKLFTSLSRVKMIWLKSNSLEVEVESIEWSMNFTRLGRSSGTRAELISWENSWNTLSTFNWVVTGDLHTASHNISM